MNDFAPQVLIILIFAIIGVAFAAIMIVPYWKIYTRTGQSGALALLQLVPLVNIVMLYLLAFAEWPIERQSRDGRDLRS